MDWFPLLNSLRVALIATVCTVCLGVLAAGRTLGRSNTWVFWRVLLPGCRQGLLAGTVLAFARGLGEYGATSMVSGYTPGRTATISTTVYQLWREGNDLLAYRWVGINMAISFAVLLSINLLERRQRQSARPVSEEVQA